jgi:hypothetical protein
MARQLSPAGYRKLLDDDSPSTSVSDGLEYVPHGGRAEPRKPTAEQIREQARARDPESWKRAEAMRTAKHEQGREDEGDRAELAARRLDEAIEDGSEALIVARAVEFKKVSPAGFRAFLEEQDEYYLQQRDEYGLDPDDFDESEMPGAVLGNEVAHAIELEQTQALYAQTRDKIAGLEHASHVVYNGRLKERGKLPSPDDEQGNAYHAAVADYIFETSGIHLAQLVDDGRGDEAAEHWLRADSQLAAMDKEARLQVFKRGIVEQEDGSVAAGIKTSGDATAEKLDELIGLQRAAQGLGPVGAPLRGYDPSFEPEQPQAEIEAPATAAEIKASVRDDTVSAEGGPSVKADGAFTVDGEPTSYAEVIRDRDAEERTEREARDAAGIPKSL